MARESSMMLLPTRSRTASIVFASGMCFGSISQRSAPSLSGIEKGSRSRVVAIFRTHVAILPPSSGESHKLDHPIDFLPPYQKFESTSLQRRVSELSVPEHRATSSEGCCQVNFSRSEKPEAGCSITLPPPHSAIRSPLRLERSVALIARRDGVED